MAQSRLLFGIVTMYLANLQSHGPVIPVEGRDRQAEMSNTYKRNGGYPVRMLTLLCILSALSVSKQMAASAALSLSALVAAVSSWSDGLCGCLDHQMQVSHTDQDKNPYEVDSSRQTVDRHTLQYHPIQMAKLQLRLSLLSQIIASKDLEPEHNNHTNN